jgi:hypothetical protein
LVAAPSPFAGEELKGVRDSTAGVARPPRGASHEDSVLSAGEQGGAPLRFFMFAMKAESDCDSRKGFGLNSREAVGVSERWLDARRRILIAALEKLRAPSFRPSDPPVTGSLVVLRACCASSGPMRAVSEVESNSPSLVRPNWFTPRWLQRGHRQSLLTDALM